MYSKDNFVSSVRLYSPTYYACRWENIQNASSKRAIQLMVIQAMK